MHGGFKRPAIVLIQRLPHSGVDNAVQFLHIDINAGT
jgi:hypothetical protein